MIDQTDKLKSLGSGKTEYPKEGPSVSLLETFPNQFPDRWYTVRHESEEFTSLCPKTGQPDFATITIDTIPGATCIESKSLKLYLFAYRNEGTFMETLTNRILNDLVAACSPRWMKVEAVFGARGGIQTTVWAEHGCPNKRLSEIVARMGDRDDGRGQG